MLMIIFGSFLIAKGSLAEPVGTMLNFIGLYENGKAGFIRFMDVIEITPSVTEKPDAASPVHVNGRICFDKVSFHYPDSTELILNELSLEIKSGQTVAFAGASGIGKTTAASLIARFYDVCNGTILDNIRYGKKDATMEEIITAAKLANIHDFIVSLKHGYNSFVGTKGIRLSGGQRQRISIARLFLKNPKILILDEATSALDYESEKMIRQSLEL